MEYNKKVESVSFHSRQLKRNLEADYIQIITHEDIINLEPQSLSNTK